LGRGEVISPLIAHFLYGVRKEAAEGADGLDKVHHFGGVA